MRNAFLVAFREYIENAKTKGFWIGILMLPVTLFLSFQVPAMLEKRGAPTRYFVVADLSGGMEKVIDAALEQQYQHDLLQALNQYARENTSGRDNPIWREFGDESPAGVEKFLAAGGREAYFRRLQKSLKPGAPQFQEPRRRVRRVPLPVEGHPDFARLAQELRPFFKGERLLSVDGKSVKLDSAVLIPANLQELVVRPYGKAAGGQGLEYWSGNLADKWLRDQVERAVNEEIRRRESIARGVDLALYQEIEKTHLPITELDPKKEAGKERVGTAETLAQWAPVAFVYLLWVSIFSISQMLLSNTIEEKSNRIIEVLLSSVTPAEFVLGKLAGIAAVGLTMVSAWVISLFAVVSWKTGHSEVAGQFLTLLRGSHLIPAFVIYFFLGYILYAGIILSIGSVCNTLKEAQSYMGVITLLLMVPLLTMTFIPKDPNGTVATALSWIPIYTPFVMMNRAAADPPLRDLIGTMLLLLVSATFVLWSAVKIFRIGILRTGQPPRLVEMLKWITAK